MIPGYVDRSSNWRIAWVKMTLVDTKVKVQY
jgi:hypothetical protein